MTTIVTNGDKQKSPRALLTERCKQAGFEISRYTNDDGLRTISVWDGAYLISRFRLSGDRLGDDELFSNAIRLVNQRDDFNTKLESIFYELKYNSHKLWYSQLSNTANFFESATIVRFADLVIEDRGDISNLITLQEVEGLVKTRIDKLASKIASSEDFRQASDLGFCSEDSEDGNR